MSEAQNRMIYLLRQYADDLCTSPELTELLDIIQASREDETLYTFLQDEWNNVQPATVNKEPDWNNIYHSIIGHEKNNGLTKNTKVIPLYRRSAFKWIAAASIIIVISSLFLLMEQSEKSPAIEVAKTQDVAPGSFKARLTLADGTVIVLDSAAEGQLATQGQTAVINKDGKIIYQGAANSDQRTANNPVYNTLSTANGESYSVTLSDGTKVWLNAASSIKYPVAFNSNERRVEITGEAYFEVRHNSKQPFKVFLPNGSIVEDLGTAFNINAYSDEAAIKTTLIEGSLRVVGDAALKANNGKVLKPGEQASINQANPGITRIEVQTIDVDKVVSWKSNEFNFSDDDIQTIMRQLARWYNIQPIITAPTETQYTGRITRNVPLSEVLKMFEQVGYVKFEIKDRVVRVIPVK